MSENMTTGALPITAVFLDRDGTIIEDRSYLGDPAGVTPLPGSVAGLARLAARGLRLFIVTNQSGIGRGYFNLDDYLACRARLNEILAASGVHISDEAFCPHDPDAGCACRKPALGMWEGLRDRHLLNPENCIIIGDKAGDLEFGYAAGFALSILVLTGEGQKTATRLGVSLSDLSLPGVTRLGPDCPGTAISTLEAMDNTGRPLLLARDLNAAANWLLPHLAESTPAAS